MSDRILKIAAVTLLGISTAGLSYAADPLISTSQVSAQMSAGTSNMTLSVSGPNGYHTEAFSKSSNPSVSMAEGGTLADGQYTWETRAASNQMVKVNNNGLDNGRGANERAYMNVPVIESGTFRVLNGAIVSSDVVEEKASVKADR